MSETVVAIVWHEQDPSPRTTILWPGSHVGAPRALTDPEIAERIFPHRFDRDRIVRTMVEEVAWTRLAHVQRFTYELEELTA